MSSEESPTESLYLPSPSSPSPSSPLSYASESPREYPPIDTVLQPGKPPPRYDPLYEFNLIEELVYHGVVRPHLNSHEPRGTEALKAFQSGNKLLRLSSHPRFCVDFVLRYPTLPWSASSVSSNVRNLRELIKIHRAFPQLLFFGRGGLSSNPHVDITWVEAFPDEGWCLHALDGLSSAPRFCFEWVERLGQMGGLVRPGNIMLGNFGVSRYSVGLSLDDLEEYQDLLAWGIFGLSENPSLDVSWLRRFPDKPWCWKCVQRNPNFCLSWLPCVPEGERLSSLLQHPVPDDLQTEPLLHQSQYSEEVCRFLIAVADNRSLYSWPPCVLRLLKSWDVSRCVLAPQLEALPGDDPNIYDRFDITWVERFPSTNWIFGVAPSVGGLSSHRNALPHWIARYPTKAWDFGFGGLSSAPRLRLSWILDMPSAGWSQCGILSNPSFSFDWVPHLLRIGILSESWPSNMRLNSRMHFSNDIQGRHARKRRALWTLCKRLHRGGVYGLLARRVAAYLCRS